LAVATATVAAHEAHPTSTGLNSRKMLFWAFLGSECLLFGALISTYLLYKGRGPGGKPDVHRRILVLFHRVTSPD